MVLYKTIFCVAASTVEQCTWQASQADASKERAQRKRDGFKVVGTQTVEVPTTKGPLLEWLNDHVKA